MKLDRLFEPLRGNGQLSKQLCQRIRQIAFLFSLSNTFVEDEVSAANVDSLKAPEHVEVLTKKTVFLSLFEFEKLDTQCNFVLTCQTG